MLAVMGSMALVLFGAVPASQDSVISNICSSDFFDMDSSAGGFVSFKNEGQVHRPSELYLAGDNIEAIWPLGSPEPFSTMTFFEAQLRLPETTAFPVAVSVYADGKRVWEGQFTEPTNYIIDGGVLDGNAKVDLFSGKGSPFVVIASDKERPIPNLYGVASLSLAATDAQGKQTKVAVRLPKWSWVARKTDQAIVKAKRTGVYGECGRPTMPEPVWPVRKPRNDAQPEDRAESGEGHAQAMSGPIPSSPFEPARPTGLACTRNSERIFAGPEPNPFAALTIDEGCDLSDTEATKLELL